MIRPSDRSFVYRNRSVEIIGASKSCRVWIDDKTLQDYKQFKSLRAARIAAKFDIDRRIANTMQYQPMSYQPDVFIFAA